MFFRLPNYFLYLYYNQFDGCYTFFLIFYMANKALYRTAIFVGSGIRLGWQVLPDTATPVFLQVLRKPFPIQNSQLVQHLVPAPVTLRPFLWYILAYQIQHFSRNASLGNTLFVLVIFQYRRFSPSVMFVVYIIRRMPSGNWKKELMSSQLRMA